MSTIDRRGFLSAGFGGVALSVLPMWGCSSGSVWPPAASIAGPTALGFNGRRFQTSAESHTLVIVDRDGKVLNVGGLGLTQEKLNYPTDVAVVNGLAYVVECGNHRVQVFDGAGRSVGILGEGVLFHPSGIAVSSTNEIFVSDSRNSRVVGFNVDGRVTHTLGVGVLSAPHGLAMADDGLLVADPGLRKVLLLGFDGSLRGEFGSNWVLPWDVATDGKNVFVADVSKAEIAVLTTGGERIDSIPINSAPGYLSFRDDTLYYT